MEASSFGRKLAQAQSALVNHDFAQAKTLLTALTSQFPQKAQGWFELGYAALGGGQPSEAETAWQRAIILQPGDEELFLKIGQKCLRLRDATRAQHWFEKALVTFPNAIAPRVALAKLLEQNRRRVEARRLVEECLALNPHDESARAQAALLDSREGNIEAAEKAWRDLLASQPQEEAVRFICRYELADILDKTGRPDEAMEILKVAKQLAGSDDEIAPHLREYDQQTVVGLRATRSLPPDSPKRWARDFPAGKREHSFALAFLGGHPRSGTTLLEQVLGTHPGVMAVDESPVFRRQVFRLFNQSTVINPARLNILRRVYREGMERELGGGLPGKLLLDKNPSPTTLLRVWLQVFPEIKVLIALRDPRDVVLSCYFQNFPFNPSNANFLTLERTARHYADLMDVWLAVRAWAGFAWLETRYEDMVADLPKEGKRVTEFLGLTWDAAQETYHQPVAARPLYSPTYHDASQPVYTRAVARWQRYAKYLEPVQSVLEPYCRVFGYT